jgi:hypothetical protein
MAIINTTLYIPTPPLLQNVNPPSHKSPVGPEPDVADRIRVAFSPNHVPVR